MLGAFNLTVSRKTLLSGPVVSVTLALAIGITLRALYTSRIATPDECFTWRLIQYDYRELITRTAADVHPPGYYVLAKLWTSIFGIGVLSIRTLSVLFGAASIPFAYWTTSRTLEPGRPNERSRDAGATVAALAFAIHPMQIEITSSARMYGVGAFLTVASSLALVKALAKPSLRAWGCHFVLAACLCYTHYYGLLTVVAQLAFAAVWNIRQSPGKLGAPMGSTLALFLVGLPWARTLFSQMRAVQIDYWIEFPTRCEMGDAITKWTFGVDAHDWLSLTIALGMTTAVLLMLVSTRGSAIRLLFVAQCTLPLLLCTIYSIAMQRPIYQLRYTIFAHASFMICVGLAIGSIDNGGRRCLAACLCGCVFCASCAHSVGVAAAERDTFRQAFNFLSQHYDDDDCIFDEWVGAVNRLRYYAWEASLVDTDVRCPKPSDNVGGHRPYVASLTSNDFTDGKTWSTPARASRCWVVRDGPTIVVPRGLKLVLSRSFGSRYARTVIVELWTTTD